MDNYILQTLISQGKIVSAGDIDPDNSYLQVGVYQPGNRKSRSANDAYPSFAIPLSEIGGTDICKAPLPFKEGTVGPKVSFKKADYADPNITKDIIIPGVLEITRGNNQGLYNIAIENSFNTNSPKNTGWSSEYVNPNNTSWGPLENLTNRTYTRWYDAIKMPTGSRSPSLQVGMFMILR